MVLIPHWHVITWSILISKILLGRKLDEIAIDPDSFRNSLIDLNLDDLRHGFLNVEKFWRFDEAIILDLCVAEDVFNIQQEHLRRRRLDIVAARYLLDDIVYLLKEVKF